MFDDLIINLLPLTLFDCPVRWDQQIQMFLRKWQQQVSKLFIITPLTAAEENSYGTSQKAKAT
jgi:hypothetical protein